MSKLRLRPRAWAVLSAVCMMLAALAWASIPSAPGNRPLATMLPQGALMTVESADFGALVAAWNRSPEQHAWLRSANYSAFGNSGLFARLQDAQSGFAHAAHSQVDGAFLAEISGKDSIFAWYDIGNLEFLYLTRLPQDRLAKLSLLAQRSRFARREAGGTTFYIRSSNASAGTDSDGASAQGDTEADDQGSPGSSGVDQTRTVAFAVRGDWLVLATREDLIAGALQLMATPQEGKGHAASLASSGWYSAASAASSAHPGDLHMLLDLQALTKTPHFRTYWLQRNVTETRQYRAAVVDLYRESGQFREERVLLPMDTGAAEAASPDLGSLEQMVPERAGVYRAWANPATADALGALRDKVLAREPATQGDATVSPQAQTAVDPAGSSGDLDTRIDAPSRKPSDGSDSSGRLRQLLESSGLESILTVDRTAAASVDGAFVGVQSAVVLRSSAPWDKDALAQAVLQSLRVRLTTASLGLGWTSVSHEGVTYLTLGATHSVCLAINGPLAILSSDPALIEDILKRGAVAPNSALPALRLAGFRPGQERADFRHLTADLNVAQSSANFSTGPAGSSATQTTVDLFRDNLPSLADVFQAMVSERYVETDDAGKIHQAVVYRWSDQ